MPRLPRLNLAGVPQHVVQRGNTINSDPFDCGCHTVSGRWTEEDERRYQQQQKEERRQQDADAAADTAFINGGNQTYINTVGGEYIPLGCQADLCVTQSQTIKSSGVFQGSCRLKLNFMPPFCLLF